RPDAEAPVEGTGRCGEIPGRAHGTSGAGSFRVRGDVEEIVGVALRPVVEAPIVVHARLEAGRIELLGLERGMPPVTQEERELLAEGLDLPRTRTGGRSLLTPECS